MVKVTPLGFVAANEKIMDINEDDVDVHICSISTKVPPNCVAIILWATRPTGTGELIVYPNEGSTGVYLERAQRTELVAIGNQRLKFSQSVANDDWDVWMVGYFVEGQVKK